jgi:serine/threonine protein kinase
MLEAGRQPLPGFTLRGRIGAGSLGEVWNARDPSGRPVALKFLDCRALRPSAVAAEIRMARSVQQLQHPNFIELLGVYPSRHYLVLCMERADGNLEGLRRAYQEEAGLNIPADHALDLLDQAAAGLDFLAGLRLPGFNLSSGGLQHCRVRPGNLLLVGETVKLADFGLCAGWTTHRRRRRGRSRYAPPELHRGQPAPGTDQYALAVTYLLLVTGERIFCTGASAATPEALPVDLAQVPDNELPVITRGLHTQPSARWPSCQDFIGALRQAVRAAPQLSTRRPAPAGPPSGQPVTAGRPSGAGWLAGPGEPDHWLDDWWGWR